MAYEVVRDVVQTPDGATWFATWGGGISRLFQSRWTTYTFKDGLPSNDVRTLYLDTNNQLWSGTRQGLARLEGDHWVTIPIPYPEEDSRSIFSICEIEPQRFWIGTANGLILEYHPSRSNPQTVETNENPLVEEKTWSIQLDSTISKGKGVRAIYPLRNGTVLAGISALGIIAFDKNGWHFQQPDIDLRSIVQGKEGIWASGQQSIYFNNGNEWQLQTWRFKDLTSILESPQGILYAGSLTGLYIYDANQWVKIALNKLIPYPAIETIKCMQDGIIWVGTRFGVYRIAFSPWELFSRTEDGIGLDGFVFYADPQTKPLSVDQKGRLVRFEDESWKPSLQLNSEGLPPESLSDRFQDTIWALFKDEVLQISLTNNTILHRIPTPPNLSFNNIYISNAGIVFIFGQAGVYKFEDGSWQSCAAHSPNFSQYIRFLGESQDNTYWVGLDDKIIQWKEDQIVPFQLPLDFLEWIPYRIFYQDRNRRIWLGGYGCGMVCYDGNQFQRYSTVDGLASDRITCINESTDGTIWVGTDMMGVSAFRDGRWISYVRENGLTNKKVTSLGEYPKGAIWASVLTTGLYRYRHDESGPDTTIEEYLTTIAPGDRGVFHFTGLDEWKETEQEDLVYSWRILPQNGDPSQYTWTPFDKEKVVVSPLLKYGNYYFQVRAADKDFNIDSTPAQVSFYVMPFIWQRYDIWLLFLFLAGILVHALRMIWQKQRALFLSEKNYRELVESIHEIIYTTNQQGIITYISPGVELLSGFKPHELIGHPFYEILYKDDLERMMDNFQIILNGSAKTGEYRFIKKNQEILWLRTSSHPAIEKNRIIGVSGIATDITDRKRVEEALQLAYADLELRIQERTAELLQSNVSLREEIIERQRIECALKNSEERLMQIITNMPVMLDAFDEKGNIVFWNKECERVSGFTALEILDNSEAMRFLYPDDRYRKSVFDTMHQFNLFFRDIEFDITCKDGNKRTISWSNISSKFPIPGWTSWGIGIDITKRKEAQEALQQSEKKFRALFNHASDPIFILDRIGRFLEVNDESCVRLGYSREEMLEMFLSEILFFEEKSDETEGMKPLTHIDHAVYESKFRTKDGTIIPVEVSYRTFEFKGHSAILSICRDITFRKQMEEERRKIEEQLRQAQKMEAVGQLAGGVAHDFNNLLHVILGYTQMAMVGLSCEEQRYQYLNKSRIAAERSANLTRQLLAFSRRQALNQKYVDFNQIVHEFITMLERIIGEDIELQLQLASHLDTVFADPGMMDQVLMNLCVNARDAMPEGGRLTIATENAILTDQFCENHPWARPGRFVHLTVQDTGTGMSPEVMEHIYEPFYTTKEQGRGTGLGLSTVYGSVKQHNGLLHVASFPGQGSIFSIYLPSMNATAEGGATKSEIIESSRGTETILLAEDETLVRDLAVQVLNENGYTVLIACDGEEAIHTFRKHANSIQLVILDMIMPKFNGREVYRQIAQIQPDVEVLFSSGYSMDLSNLKNASNQRLPLIQKPYSPSSLLKKVRELLDAPHPSHP